MSRRNLCVVVTIPDPAGREIDIARRRYEPTEGKLPAHITVLPPVHVAEKDVPTVVRHVEAVAAEVPAFDVRLTGTGTFRPRSPVVFVAIAGGVDELGRIEHAVRAAGIAPPSHRPYRPHVTVAHRVDDNVLDDAFAHLAKFDALVRIESISLYEHRDRRWELVRNFPLVG